MGSGPLGTKPRRFTISSCTAMGSPAFGSPPPIRVRAELRMCAKESVRSRKNPPPAHRFLRTSGCELTSKVPLQKLQSCNGALGSKQNGRKSRERSSLKMLVRQVMDALQSCLLGVGQNHRPNGITHVSKAIGNTEPQTVDWIGVHFQRHIPEGGGWLQPFAELNAVLHPLAVEALRRLVQDQLQNRPARCNLEEPGTAHLAFPKATAPFADVASPGDPLLLLNHLPKAHAAQNKATI